MNTKGCPVLSTALPPAASTSKTPAAMSHSFFGPMLKVAWAHLLDPQCLRYLIRRFLHHQANLSCEHDSFSFKLVRCALGVWLFGSTHQHRTPNVRSPGLSGSGFFFCENPRRSLVIPVDIQPFPYKILIMLLAKLTKAY